VVVDGELMSRSPTVRVTSLAEGGKRVRIWLPRRAMSALARFQADAALTPLPRRPSLAGYGSSITQCRLAAGPSETWPASWHAAGLVPAVSGVLRRMPLDPASPGTSGTRGRT